MKTIRTLTLALAALGVLAVAIPVPAHAANPKVTECSYKNFTTTNPKGVWTCTVVSQ